MANVEWSAEFWPTAASSSEYLNRADVHTFSGISTTSGCPRCPCETASVQERPPANCSYPGVLGATAEKLRAPELVLCALWSVPDCEIVQLGIFFFFLLVVAKKVRSQAKLVTFWWSCSVGK